MKNKIYYWSPFLTNVATIKAVLNSAFAINKYLKSNEVSILNAVGEFEFAKKIEKYQNLKFLNLIKFNLHKYLPTRGFMKSRISYLIIFFLCFFSLKNILKKNKPDYLIIHLITSLPIVLNSIFKLDTKIILRISGLPKMNFLRKFIWINLGKSLHMITTPTLSTKNYLIKNKIFPEEKIFVLRDPVISIKNVNKQKKENLDYRLINKDFILGIGRLTKQKNFEFLIKNFKIISQNNKTLHLVILGDGEEKNKLLKIIKKLDISDKVFLLGFQKNIYPYLKYAKCFILSSLWEDPGFVLIEAASSNSLIISSNCPNGPEELIENDNGGFIYLNNNSESFQKKFNEFLNDKYTFRKKIFIKKKVLDFTEYRHADRFSRIINEK